MSLTLPIVAGKKYVRRDGEIITASTPGKNYAKATSALFVCVARGQENRESGRYNAFAADGRILPDGLSDDEKDLVSDYVEPAKSHPHAALMMDFAKDAAESETPWDWWEFQASDDHLWSPCEQQVSWVPHFRYRRKPTLTPDPHAENAAEYAKDMAETEKAWERWEKQSNAYPSSRWIACFQHPEWHHDVSYRRKAAPE